MVRAGRMQLVGRQDAVAVAVEGLERGGGVGDFRGGELAVLIGVEGEQQRRWATVGRWRWCVFGRGGGSCGLS